MTPTTPSFYTDLELTGLGLGSVGDSVKISRFARIYNPGNVYIGSHVRIDDFVIVSAGKQVRLGDYIHIGAFSALYGSEGITIGDFSGLSTRVTVYTASDDYSGDSLTNPTVPLEYRLKLDCGAVTLGRHAIVGAHAVLMPGVALGEGAAVGAQSLVMKDCEPWAIYFGSPARRLKERSRELLKLEEALRSSTQHRGAGGRAEQ